MIAVCQKTLHIFKLKEKQLRDSDLYMHEAL